MPNKHFWPLVCILAFLTTLWACGTGPSPTLAPPSSQSDFIYALTLAGSPNSATSQLSSLKLDASNGSLSSPSTVAFGSQIVPGIAVDAGSKFLYASYPDFGADAIGIFAIDANTGAPTQTGVYPLSLICVFCPFQSGPGELTLSPSGHYLFYGSSALGGGVSQGIGVLALDSTTGSLNSVQGSPFPVDQAPFLVRVHPSGRFVYTENVDPTGAGGIVLQNLAGFSFDAATGVLAPMAASPFAPPVSAVIGELAIHPSGKFLYVASGMAGHGILGWSIDGISGELTPLPDSPYQTGAATLGVAVDPSGKFLYTSAGTAGGILGFTVDTSSGALTPLAGSPFSANLVLAGPSIEPSGKFLFAADGKDNTIRGFSIESQTGVLVPLASSAGLGARPLSMTIVKAP